MKEYISELNDYLYEEPKLKSAIVITIMIWKAYGKRMAWGNYIVDYNGFFLNYNDAIRYMNDRSRAGTSSSVVGWGGILIKGSHNYFVCTASITLNSKFTKLLKSFINENINDKNIILKAINDLNDLTWYRVKKSTYTTLTKKIWEYYDVYT